MARRTWTKRALPAQPAWRTAVPLGVVLIACAQEDAPLGAEPQGPAAASSASSTSAGAGAQGGDGGAGGLGGMGGDAGHASGGGAPPDTCGNGVLDPHESCEGSDFGALTCQALGYEAGELVCDATCAIVPGSCLSEVCTNDVDDDGDNLVDCNDTGCAGAVACAGACTAPLQIQALPVDFSSSFVWPDTTGDPSAIHPSCTIATGPDHAYEVIAPVDGTMRVFLNLANFFNAPHDASLSIRSACADAATELACVDDAGEGLDETVSIPVTAGTSYFVIVDGTTPEEFGEYLLHIALTCSEESPCAAGYVCFPPWEGSCHQSCESHADCPAGFLCSTTSVTEGGLCI